MANSSPLRALPSGVPNVPNVKCQIFDTFDTPNTKTNPHQPFYISKNLEHVYSTVSNMRRYGQQCHYCLALFNSFFVSPPLFVSLRLSVCNPSLSLSHWLSLSDPTTIIITTRSVNRPNHHYYHHSITPHPATIITHPDRRTDPFKPKPTQSEHPATIITHPDWRTDPLKLSRPSPRHFRAMEMWVLTKPATSVMRTVRPELERR